MDVHTPEQRSRNMRAIKSRDTKIEIILGKALWSRGYRYRRQNKKIFGNPDFTLRKHKIAIFVDGEYFHGKDWETNKYRIKTNRDFWWKKIEGNMKRDIVVNEALEKEGWIVLRFWGTEIKKNLDICLLKVEEAIGKRRDD